MNVEVPTKEPLCPLKERPYMSQGKISEGGEGLAELWGFYHIPQYLSPTLFERAWALLTQLLHRAMVEVRNHK